MAKSSLATIGAHTINHVMLAKCPASEAREEMKRSREVIEAALGVRCEHFAFPVGDKGSAGSREFHLARELGFKTAVTTRPGVLYPEHREYLTALPRVSLNGHFQAARFVDVFLSGAPFALWNRLSSASTRRNQSGRDIQRIKRPAGNTQTRPSTTKTAACIAAESVATRPCARPIANSAQKPTKASKRAVPTSLRER